MWIVDTLYLITVHGDSLVPFLRDDRAENRVVGCALTRCVERYTIHGHAWLLILGVARVFGTFLPGGGANLTT